MKLNINDMELSILNYKRDYIRSEITNNKLLRIKCETKIKGRDNSEKLRGILGNKNFIVSIPSEELEFKAREGEISYHYIEDNQFDDINTEYNHVIEIIEFEDIPKEIINEEIGIEDIDHLRKRVMVLEELLVNKGIITKEEIKELLSKRFRG